MSKKTLSLQKLKQEIREKFESVRHFVDWSNHNYAADLKYQTVYLTLQGNAKYTGIKAVAYTFLIEKRTKQIESVP